LDQSIAVATADWTRGQVSAEITRGEEVLARPAPPRPAAPAAPALAGRKLPTPPPWWKGDEEAMRSSLVAAQQLRRGR
jgi:hypothetical protein